MHEFLIEVGRLSRAEHVGNQIIGIIVRVQTVAHRPAFHERGRGYVAVNGLQARRRLALFRRVRPVQRRTRRNVAKPLLGQSEDILRLHIARHYQHCVVGTIIATLKVPDHRHVHLRNVLQLLADRQPLVGMLLIDHPIEQHHQVTIRSVQEVLLELFHHHLFLHVQGLLLKTERIHTVSFKPEGCFHIAGRQHDVVVGQILGGVGIVEGPDPLEYPVVIGSIGRTGEHIMFHQMGHAGMVRMLIAGADPVGYVDSHDGRGGVFMNKDP